MQSGISATPELQDAFKTFLETESSLALLITIESERLVPMKTIQSDSSPFPSCLSLINASIASDEAAYILLRTPNGLSAITYVPDTAPVRSKMLFASTRLTLTRELGSEHFPETVFMTNKADVSESGWRAHEASREAENPLTSAEAESKMLRETEIAGPGPAAATARMHGMTGPDGGSSAGHLALKVSDELKDALTAFKDAGAGALLTVKFDVQTETLHPDNPQLQTVSAPDLASSIPASDPRYALYKYNDAATVLFIYTCPSTSKIKERMIYAACRARFVNLVETDPAFAITIAKKLEGSSPEEFTAAALLDEFRETVEVKSGFARPKRPGRR